MFRDLGEKTMLDKLILDNGKAHLVIDTRTGEFLEIYSCRNHDNLIKNLMDDIAEPFRITVKSSNGDNVAFLRHGCSLKQKPTPLPRLLITVN